MAEGSTLTGNQIIQPLDDLLFQLLPEQHQCPHFSLFPRSGLGHHSEKKLVPASASPRGCNPRWIQGQEKGSEGQELAGNESSIWPVFLHSQRTWQRRNKL